MCHLIDCLLPAIIIFFSNLLNIHFLHPPLSSSPLFLILLPIALPFDSFFNLRFDSGMIAFLDFLQQVCIFIYIYIYIVLDTRIYPLDCLFTAFLLFSP